MTNRARVHRSRAAEPSKPVQQPAGDDGIRVRAYELYERRGGGAGDADGDWYKAEAELKPRERPD